MTYYWICRWHIDRGRDMNVRIGPWRSGHSLSIHLTPEVL